MFKYERDIMERNKKYKENLVKMPEWKDLARAAAFWSMSSNTQTALATYYTWVEGEGYIRVKTANGIGGIDRSDRDLFEQNDINYPSETGLNLMGQTFFNPITDEKFYWVKVGWASDLKRRRTQYKTCTAMIWDIGYYVEDDLKEMECHEKLKNICLHRHADEWFSVPREDYLKICKIGFAWFKEA